ncbi:MAG: hypothetical protein RL660_526 [Bacteroidota bacterium]|jgi:hypothetical protein
MNSYEQLPKVIKQCTTLSYDAYVELVQDLFNKQQLTSGEPTEDMLHYTKLNLARMNRVEKTVELTADLVAKLNGLSNKVLYAITEGWCGDAAQILPVFQKIATAAGIDLHIVLRDQNLPLIDMFLTNGTSRSIPILICVEQESLNYCWHWGPRPKAAQELLDKLKQEGADMEEQKLQLHAWYAQDKSVSTLEALMPLITGK